MRNELRIAVKLTDKPDTCPQCGGKIVDIVYGEPTAETMDAVERGEVMLGGCCITEDAPEWQCVRCGQHYKQK